MRLHLLLSAFLFIASLTVQGQQSFTGRVLDGNSLPVHGANIKVVDANVVSATDPFGYFSLVPEKEEFLLEVSHIGYETRIVPVNTQKQHELNLVLEEGNLQLSEVSVTAEKENKLNIIGQVDLKLRAINNSQEVLRAVSGLFIAQHAGGGKAEQIFLRGFDIDHGTDIALSVDGVPVNMVSHAHGQGYSDLHFVIPETIERVHFEKGTYYADKGNFNTAGFAEFRTKKSLNNNLIKIEGGDFGTFRTVGMVNLLPQKLQEKQQHAFIATELFRSDGYFESPQGFKRFNLLGKYHGKVGEDSWLTASLSSFYSDWSASGQIPERAVKSGQITRFGAIDDTEGGETSRQNVNLSFLHKAGQNGWLKHQAYFSNYDFELYSNFTFFLNDPVNGDQIKQKENRNLFGYQSTYSKDVWLGSWKVATQSGVGFRYDNVDNNELNRTIAKETINERIAFGDVDETNVFAFVEAKWSLAAKLEMTTGLRMDYFQFNYADKLTGVESSKNQGLLSPKLRFDYLMNSNVSLFLKSGIGFHSNDSRVAVTPNSVSETLPKAFGVDLGGTLKPSANLLVTVALWALRLDQEFVYVGDEGIVEPSGKTLRRGIETSVRYQVTSSLFLDTDLTFTRARALEAAENEAYIPLAPSVTAAGGATWKSKTGFSVSLRYRYLHDRPANEDYSLEAKGYFVTDAVLGYTKGRYNVGLSVENLLNTEWNEAQFATESRLYNEPISVEEIHFTPGTPLFVKGSVSFSF
ncbi:TonB-dependent receptor [Flammeovirgaceae bacterium SG7u.111]|nr:TonB-dependent receptor [Flammeovirgaceae bacterium SG7u.132]WPO37912.1 TonB-dependent receptor [Flammeovirgaceae bacterium SG7u.111]